MIDHSLVTGFTMFIRRSFDMTCFGISTYHRHEPPLRRLAALCTWPTGQGAWRQTRRLSEDRGGMHHFRPFYDHPADLRSQIVAGRPT